jgi:hypothetical protein
MIVATETAPSWPITADVVTTVVLLEVARTMPPVPLPYFYAIAVTKGINSSRN